MDQLQRYCIIWNNSKLKNTREVPVSCFSEKTNQDDHNGITMPFKTNFRIGYIMHIAKIPNFAETGIYGDKIQQQVIRYTPSL
jgi:hypothetical protein